MSLRGKAFLCIWNDHDPEQAAEYEAWHTFEHVPERVCVPGFLSGRRYADYDRAESRYFTLYDLTSLDVLETAAYRDLQDNPTPWSEKMRVSFRNFERIPCSTLASAGEGCAGAVGTIVFTALRDQPQAVESMLGLLGGLMQEHLVTAYHVGVASVIPAYAVFGTAEAGDDSSETFVLIFEAVVIHNANAAICRIAAAITEAFEQVELRKCECSDLLFQIHVEDLENSKLRRNLQFHH